MKRKLLYSVCILCVIFSLISCGGEFDYQKEFTAIGTLLDRGDFNKAVEKYEAFNQQQKTDLKLLDEKMTKSLEKSGDISEKDMNRYSAISKYDVADEYDSKLFNVAYYNLKGNDRKNAAIWLYENTDWRGPSARTRVAGEEVDVERYYPSDETLDLSYLNSMATSMSLTLNYLQVGNKKYTIDSGYVITIPDPFGFTIDASVTTAYYFNVGDIADPIDSIEVSSGESFTLPELKNLKDGYSFIGWSQGYSGDSPNNKTTDLSKFLKSGDTQNFNISGSRTFYAMYERVAAADWFISDMADNSNRNGRIDRGETVKLIPVFKNEGNLYSYLNSYTVGALAEDAAKYITVKQVGDINTASDKKGFYPGYGLAVYNDSYYNSINEPFDDITYSGNMMKRFNEDSTYYIEVTAAADTPEGFTFDIPFSVKGSAGTYDSRITLTTNTNDASIKVVDYKLREYGNNDGIVNPGEKVYLEAIFTNEGSSDSAYGLKHVMTTDSPYISFISSSATHAFLIPGEFGNSRYCDYNSKEKALSNANPSDSKTNLFSFTVSSATPKGTIIPLKITTTDGLGYVYENTINLTVVYTGGYVSLATYNVVESTGDKDGTINPGETFLLDPCFKNTGASNLVNARVVFTTSTPGVSIASDGNIISWKSFKTGKFSNSTSYDLSKEATGNKGRIKVTVSKDYDISNPIVLDWKVTADGNPEGWSGKISVPVTSVNSEFVYYGHKFFETEGNMDDVVSPGESFAIDVALRNAGTAKSAALSFTISSDSKYITITKPGPYNWNAVDAGRTVTVSRGVFKTPQETTYTKSSSIRINLSKDFPIGTTEYFTVNVTDGINTWKINVPVTAKLPDTRIVVDDFSFVDSLNGNGKVEIGESAYFDMRIRNSGSALAKGVDVKLSVVEGNVIITSGSYSYGDVKAGQYKTIYRSTNSYSKAADARLSNNSNYSTSLAFRIPNDTEPGSTIKLKAEFTDSYGQSWERVFTFTAEKPVLGVSEGVSFYNKQNYELLYPGENPRIKVDISNTSPSAINGAAVTITSDSRYVSGLPLTMNFRDVLAKGNSTSVTSDRDRLSISSSAPIGEKITFNLLFKDSSGLTYEATREYTVGPERANIVVSNQKTRGLSPDGGTSVVPGGYVFLDAVMRNIGAKAGTDVTVRFSTDSDIVTLSQPSVSFATMAKGSYYTMQSGASYTQEAKAVAALLTGPSGVEAKISEEAKAGDQAVVDMQVYEGTTLIGESSFRITVR